MTNITVLTGDLIGSTDMSGETIRDAMSVLQAMAAAQASWTGRPGRFSRHRGDGWQVILPAPEFALRAVLSYAAALRMRDVSSYMALATGAYEGALPEDLNDATGPVFAASGRLLEEMKSGKSKRISLTPSGPRAATLALADHLSQGWTKAQAATILPMLDPAAKLSFTALAKPLGKSRQAVSKALDGAGFNAVKRALAHYESPEAQDD
ncbi:MAG: hypothetical protein ACRBCL_10360 [Maritimibacter sp.]